MKRDEKRGWEMVRWGIGLGAVSCLLMYLSYTAAILELSGPLYYLVLISSMVIEVAMVYILVRKFFGKKDDQ